MRETWGASGHGTKAMPTGGDGSKQGQQDALDYQKRSFIYLDGPIIKRLYTNLVRPFLEYGNFAWMLTLKRDQQMLENVQRRATKLVPELNSLEWY